MVRPAPAAHRVADALREEILAGGLRPGAQLVEESLAGTLGVSRNTVREAYALLAGERIVERIPARGVFVARPGVDDVRVIYLVRAGVEPAAVRWGRDPEPDELDQLDSLVSTARRAASTHDWPTVAQANHDFHRMLVDLSGSRRCIEWFAAVLAELRLVFLSIDDVSFHGPYVDDNARVLALLRDGDRPGAADFLHDYLTRAGRDVLSRMQ
jgi:DNA-binding GntR family transcriptional regulator